MKGYWHLLFIGCAAPAMAGPLPPPPPDFAGAQYIDAQGCVFMRAGQEWAPRPDPAGGQLCGFPPSLEVRRLDPDTVDVLPPSQPAGPADPAAILAERLAEELRQADLNGDVLPPPPDMPRRRPNPLAVELATAVAASGAVSSSLAGLAGAPADVCRRMGYRNEALPEGQRDPTGLCAGLRPATPQSRHAAAPAAARNAAAVAVPPALRVATRAPAGRARPVTNGAARAAAAGAPAPRQAEMIPAHARYVQIGEFADAAAADAAARALIGRGLPAAKGKTGTRVAVMAGPFPDRRSLIATLNQLRRAGWPRATAR